MDAAVAPTDAERRQATDLIRQALVKAGLGQPDASKAATALIANAERMLATGDYSTGQAGG